MLTPKRSGYITLTSHKVTYEADTCTCKHCNKAWIIRSTKKGEGDPGGWCRICSAPICPDCAGKECMPFEKKLKIYESKQKLFKELGL